MARTSEITIHEGIGKDSKKPYKAVKVRVGTWDKLLFLSPFEMEYIEAQLQEEQINVQPPVTSDEDKIDLNAPVQPINDGIFDK